MALIYFLEQLRGKFCERKDSYSQLQVLDINILETALEQIINLTECPK